MVAFGSFATVPDAYVRPDAYTGSDDDMELDDDQYVAGSKLTYPGESLTSTHAFMRYAPFTHFRTSIRRGY